MRPSVRDAFVSFTAPMEGVCTWMYCDVLGLVTTAIGNLIDPIQIALPIPFRHADGTFATRNEVAAEWSRIKARQDLKMHGGGAYRAIATLHLDSAGVDLVVSRKLSQMDAYLAIRFPDYEDWPADAQLATLSMSWACGPAFHFAALEADLRAGDFASAATHCTINESGNPGVIPRNVANRVLYANAARVVGEHLDPYELLWSAHAPLPEAVTGSGAIIHPWPEDPPPDDAA